MNACTARQLWTIDLTCLCVCIQIVDNTDLWGGSLLGVLIFQRTGLSNNPSAALFLSEALRWVCCLDMYAQLSGISILKQISTCISIFTWRKANQECYTEPLTAQDLVSLEPCIPPKRERGFGLTLTPLSSWSVEGGWGSGYETVIVDIDCVVTYCDSVSLIPRIVFVYILFQYYWNQSMLGLFSDIHIFVTFSIKLCAKFIWQTLQSPGGGARLVLNLRLWIIVK